MLNENGIGYNTTLKSKPKDLGCKGASDIARTPETS